MSKSKVKELQKRLNQLTDEREALEEEFYRSQEAGEDANDIEFQLSSLEILIGELEIELEILR